MPDRTTQQSSIILYETQDGRTSIQCRFENDTISLIRAGSGNRVEGEPNICRVF